MELSELKLISASNLINLRTAAGMTQAELGAALNYSDKTISKWERAEAIALWEKARTVEPDNVSVLWNLAIAYRNSGQPEKSAEMLERVRVLTGNPDLGKE